MVPDDEFKLPEWIFAKHQPAVIDRLKTEIGGAAFASKILKGSRPTVAGASASDGIVDAKSSGKKTGVADARANPDDLTADVAEAEGCIRKRLWLDDLLTALINALLLEVDRKLLAAALAVLAWQPHRPHPDCRQQCVQKQKKP
eukprot:s3547_g11.t1